ncbi:MAG: ostA-like family protein [Micavibrio sp.]|nr:ostA-like family protein [Micavibrio sp.]|tara:strand:+ start:26390 stop:27214 length:825 start_codon:yes stop_codon:yes gene_type:complete
MTKNFKLLALISFCTLFSHIQYVHAQTEAALSNGKKPLEITADGSLEWHRNDSLFIATNNALAKQGDVSLAAAKLIADYNDKDGQNIEIWRVRANAKVKITSRDTNAYGDKAVYDIDKGYAELTGQNLRLTSADQTVTAQDKFEYWTIEGKLIATGRARIIRKNERGQVNTLEADTITAYLKNNEKGQRVLDRMEAQGNVIITTPTETLTGNAGTYVAATQMAEITGNVKIKRGPNLLEGAKADVNLATNVSRMFGNGGTRGQVRGIFYPGQKN